MTTDCDVLIVGSGPVGTAIARELADLEAGLQVVVLEAGRPLGDTGRRARQEHRRRRGARPRCWPSWPPAPARCPAARPARPGTVLVGAEAMPNAAMSTNVGGMGAHWTAACPRPVDDEVPDCIDPAVLDEALSRAEQLLAVTTHAFDRAPLTGAVQQVLGELFDRPNRRPVGAMPVAVTVGEDGALHWTGPAIIAGDLWERPDVELRTGTLARRVVARRRPGDRRRGRRRGHRGAVDPHRPRRRRRRRRLAHAAAAVGLGHPARGARPVPDRAPADHGRLRPGREVRARRTHPSTSTSRSRPPRRPGGGAIVPVSGVSWVPYAADRPFHGQVMQMDASPVPLDPGVTVRPGQVVGLGWFCKKELSPDNRVWFDDDATDEHGLPAIRIDYALSAADEAAIAAAKVEIAEAAQALGRPLGEPFVMPPGSSLHYLGTTRMGTRGRRHQRLRPHRPGLGHRQPLRRRQQRHPDRHRLQSDPDRGRDRRPHRPHPGRLPGRHPAAQGAPA